MKIRLSDGWVLEFNELCDKIVDTSLYTQQIDDDGVVEWIYLGEIVEVIQL